MGLFDYTKKNWKDYPDTSTPVNAANLNHMDNQIAKLSEGANSHEESIGTIEDRLDGIDSSLTNESSETFNFGVKDGVRGFFTNPSRADDCFIPFKGFPSVGSIFSFSGTSIIDFTATDDCLFVMSTYAQNFSYIETLAELIVNTGSSEPNSYPVYTRVYKMKKGQRLYAYNYLSGRYYYSIVGIEIK